MYAIFRNNKIKLRELTLILYLKWTGKKSEHHAWLFSSIRTKNNPTSNSINQLTLPKKKLQIKIKSKKDIFFFYHFLLLSIKEFTHLLVVVFFKYGIQLPFQYRVNNEEQNTYICKLHFIHLNRYNTHLTMYSKQ